MNNDKNLLLILGEWWQQRKLRKIQSELSTHSVAGWHALLPTMPKPGIYVGSVDCSWKLREEYETETAFVYH